MKNRIQKTDGALMIEGVFGILACVLVLTFLLSFGFYLYQKTIFRIMTSEIAEEITQTYKYRNTKDATSVTKDDVTGIGKYRYLLNAGAFKASAEAKSRQLAVRRLTKTSLANEKGNVSLQIERVGDDVGRFHIELTVKQKYGFMLGDILKVIKLKGQDTLSATVYIQGTDMLFYVNTVKLANYGLGKMGDSPLLGVVNSVIKLMQSVYKIFT